MVFGNLDDPPLTAGKVQEGHLYLCPGARPERTMSVPLQSLVVRTVVAGDFQTLVLGPPAVALNDAIAVRVGMIRVGLGLIFLAIGQAILVRIVCSMEASASMLKVLAANVTSYDAEGELWRCWA